MNKEKTINYLYYANCIYYCGSYIGHIMQVFSRPPHSIDCYQLLIASNVMLGTDFAD